MKTLIFNLIKEREHVSFAELSRLIPGFEGELAMHDSRFPNVILWPAVSDDGIASLGDLMHAGKIHMHPASQLVYFTEQKRPAFPVARGFRQYKAPRWLPVTFCTYPFDLGAKTPKKSTSPRRS